MPEDSRRNLSEGWCTEGEPWSLAQQRVDPAEWERIKRDFPISKAAEQTAALSLYMFTGLIPTNQDNQSGGADGRNGAVDALLTAATGERQIMEVVSSLDPQYRNSSAAVNKFERIIAASYQGATSWALSLERGWESQRLTELAPQITDALSGVEEEGEANSNEIKIHPFVTAQRIQIAGQPTVFVSSRNAGASSFGGSYLEALTDYLANDLTIERKLNKLEREGERLGATRRHLFIGMASTGKHGGLLPSSPSFFTWGEFTPPRVIDDLWLEGGTGELYHWALETGWIFHRTHV
ncbi:hypothetical protein [Mycetocola saprophilus]|uniref:hypothetical protein n=1 Tax=Mycetocola saprophilus TaxID=76636 RepID=UPI003BF049D8